MSVSFEHSQGDVTYVFDIAVKPQVLQHIMFAQSTSAGEVVVEDAVANEYVAAPLDQKTYGMGATSAIREQPMEDHEDETTTQGREERGGTVHGASQHRGQNESQYRVKCRLLRQETAITASDNHERRDEDDHTAQADLGEGEGCGIAPQAQGGVDVHHQR
jgi:hypothetical protein